MDGFAGDTYVPERDLVRLTSQLKRVKNLMFDGRWRTLREIAFEINTNGHHSTEAAISARLRDLRKDIFGGYTVERRLREKGLFEYRVKGDA